MSNIATLEKPTKFEQFRQEVLPPERKGELFSSLPAHIRPEVFERNLLNALMQNPALLDFDPRLVYREVSKAAALGLFLDPQLGEAYIITAYNYKTKKTEPQLRIGYRGLVKLGRQSGEFTIMYAHEVHEGDDFSCELGSHKKLHHKPDVFEVDGQRGGIVGYYAVVKYHDGEFDFEPLTVAQAQGIRDRSDGWRAYKAEKIKSTPWLTDEVEMSKKTAIRKLCKRLPQSPEMAQALSIEDAAEHSEMRNITPVALVAPPAPRIALEPPSAPAPKPEPKRKPGQPRTSSRAYKDGEQTDAEIEEMQQEKLQEAPFSNAETDAYLSDLSQRLEAAPIWEDVLIIEDEHVSLNEQRMFPPDRVKAAKLIEDAKGRFANV